LSSGYQTLHVPFTPANGEVMPLSTPTPTGTTPTQIRHAYGFDQISFEGGAVPANGSGTTIAIVDAFDDPNIANDLAGFDSYFGLPGTNTNSSSDPNSVYQFFTKVNQTGGSTPPPPDSGWATEIALDVEWSHAVAPGAHILLVEANDNSFANLNAAVAFGAQYSGVVAVSTSWGGGESSSELGYDSTFQTPAGHTGVTFVASSGDSGAPPIYPAASPHVLAVGGTTLPLDSSGNIINPPGESGWSGSGGGLSSVEAQPGYQSGLVIHNGTTVISAGGFRATPDVAYDSDPSTGFPVYDTYNNPVSAPWGQWGGTSDAAPQWSALIAIADQGRALVGLTPLDGPSQTLPKLYSLPGDFSDITTGTSFGFPNYTAGPGYDLVTGLGTPFANKIVTDLIGSSVAATVPAVGSTVTVPPTSYVLNFAVAVTPSTVAASAFTVNGLPADNVAVNPAGTTATFTFNVNPVTTQGLQTMYLAGGSITLLANPSITIADFTGTFRYAAVLIQVASTNPPPGGAFTLPGGPFTLDVNFNTPLAPLSVQTTSLVLSGITGATVTGVSVLGGNTTASFTIAGLSSFGTLTATIPAGAVTDAFGNPSIAPFSANYGVVGTLPFPTPLTPVLPLGSLVYDQVASGGIAAAGDTNSFTLAVDPGQTIAVLVTPSTTTLQPTVQLLDPTNTLVASATAASAGQPVVFNPVATTAGTYTITISGAGGTPGPYTVKAVLNAAVDASNGAITPATVVPGSLANVETNDGNAFPFYLSAFYPSMRYQQIYSSSEFAQGGTIDDLRFRRWSGQAAFTSTPIDVKITLGYAATTVATASSTFANNIGAGTVTVFNGLLTLSSTGANASPQPFDAVINVAPLFNYNPTLGNLLLDVTVRNSPSGGYLAATAFGQETTTTRIWANSAAATTGNVDSPPYGLITRFDFAGTTLAAPQNIDSSFITPQPANTAVTRGAVLGGTTGALGTWNHSYAFTAAAGDTVSVALENVTGSGATVALENSSGTVLASGVSGAANFDSGISNLSLGTGGTYYLVVSGSTAATFNLVVLRNAAFDTEPNASFATAQNLDGVNGALGHITAGASLFDLRGTPVTGGVILTGAKIIMAINPDGSFITPDISTGIKFLNNEFVTPGVPLAGFTIGEAGVNFTNKGAIGTTQIPVTIQNLSSGGFHGVRIVGTVGGVLQLERVVAFNNNDEFATIATRLTNLTSSTIDNVASLENDDPDQGFAFGLGYATYNDVVLGGQLVRADARPSAFPGGLTIGLGSVDPRRVVSADGFDNRDPFQIINHPVNPGGAYADIAINLAFNFGNLAPSQAVSGTMIMVFGRTTAEAEATYSANVAGTNARDDDWYAVNVTNTAGALHYQTSTPAGGPNEFVNTLAPHLELYDPAGNLVATGTLLPDGRNEFINYQPLTTGTYRIRVTAKNQTTGEYFLAATDSLSLPPTLAGAQGGIVTVPINVDSLKDGSGHTGLSGGDLVVFYNPAVFSVSSSDVTPGTVLNASSGWSVSANTTTPGYLNIVLNAGTTITSTTGGSLAIVNFHVLANATLGANQLDLAADAAHGPDGPATITYLAGQNGNTAANYYSLSPAPVDNVTNLSPYTYAGSDPADGTIMVVPAADNGSQPATHFFVSATPQSVTAGNSVNFVVAALDASGATAIGYTGTVALGSTDTAAILPPDTTLTSGVGIFSATLKTAGSQTLTASDLTTSSITGTSNAVAVSPAAASQIIVAAPGSTTAGSAFVFTVTAQDPYGNTATGYTGTVVLASSDAQGGMPASATLSQGTGLFAAILRTAGSQTLSASDPVANLNATSNAITVLPASATQFAVSAPASTTAGSGFSFTVTALDPFNNTVPNYTGTVAFSTSSNSTLPANSTLESGVGIFSATLTTAGNQTLTATDIATSITGSSAPIAVSPGATTQFAVTGPAATTAGNFLVFGVTAEDAYNNTTTTYSGTVVFTSSDSAATFVPPSTTLIGGTGFFAAILRTAGSQTLSATDSVTSSITGHSNPIIVSPLAATHLAVNAPPTVTVGKAFGFTVTAEDPYNNTAPSYTGTVAFTLGTSDSGATLPPASTLTNGAGIFTATLAMLGNQTLLAADTLTASITGTSSTILVSRAATHFGVSAPAAAAAGSGFTFTVAAEDQFNIPVAGYSGTVAFSSSDSQAGLPAPATLTSGLGVFAAALKTVGSQTLTATDPAASIAGTSNTITVSAAPAAHFIVSTPATATAGNVFTFTVTAQDPYHNTVTGYNGTVHFTTSDSGAASSLPQDSTLAAGVGTFSAALTTAGNQTLRAVDAHASSVTGTSGAILIRPAVLKHFAVSAPAAATAGNIFVFGATAQDAYNNTITGYGGTVIFSSSDSTATLVPASATLTGGTGNFAAILRTAGSQKLAATDSVNTSITGTSNTIAVSGAAATHFIVNAPAAVGAGKVTFTVTAQDQYGNTANRYTGTVAFSSSDTAAVFTPPSSRLSAGAGTFTVTLKTLGNQTLRARDTQTSSITGTSGTIVVSPGVATHFTVTAAPSAVTAGNSVTLTVTAQDQFNNTATGYTGTVTFTSSDTGPSTSLPGSSPLTSGTGTFIATLTTAGSQTLTATDQNTSGSTGTITGTSGTIVVSAAGANALTLSAPGAALAGIAINFTVTALDRFNNTATGYNGTVTFSSTDTGANFAPASSNLSSGQGVFAVALATLGNQTLTATDNNTSGSTGTLTATSGTIAVSRLATHFAISTQGNATAGSAITITVTAEDELNITATNYTGTVLFSSSDQNPLARVPGTYTFTPADLGQHTFTSGVTLVSAGPQTVTATDANHSTLTGTSNAITVSPLSASHLTLTAPPAVTAGAAFSLTVTALDPYNNTATGYTGTVTLNASGDTAAAFVPASATLTAGVGTFTATLFSPSPSRTLTATASGVGTFSTTVSVTLAAIHLTVAAPPIVVEGSTFGVTVTATNLLGNIDPSYNKVVTVHDSVSNTDFVGFVAAGTGVINVRLVKPGSEALTASDGSLNGTSNTITVTQATHFGLGAASPQTAGSAFSFTVTAEDNYGNTDTLYSGTVAFSSSDTAAAFVPASGILPGGTNVFTATLFRAGSQTLTAGDGSISGTSGTITVTARAATHFAVSAPATPTAGISFGFTVTAEDQYNNTAPGYSGTVAFASTDSTASLPANGTLTSSVGIFSATLKTAGSQTLTATSGGNTVVFANAPGSPQPIGGSYPIDLVVGDFNGDGKLDFAAPCYFSNSVSVFFGGGGGTFSAGASYPAFNYPHAAAVGDFNGDGNLDLAIANATNDSTSVNGAVTVLLGNGNGSFQAPTSYAVGSGQTDAFSVAVGDFNGDGRQDLAVGCQPISGGTNKYIAIFLGNGNGTFGPPTDYPVGTFEWDLKAADFNHDGKLDLAVVHYNSACIGILLGNGNGTFGAETTYAVGNLPEQIAVGDLNGDGNPDLAVSNNNDNTVSVLLGNPDGTFKPAKTFATGKGPYGIVAADIDGDGKLDLVTANAGDGTVSVLLGNGDGTFAAEQTVPVDGNLFGVAAGDVNGDGKPDLAVTAPFTNKLTVLLNLTAPEFTGTTTVSVSPAAASHFAVKTPSSSVAGNALNFTVVAQDPYNNTATGYSGTVAFGSSDSVATLPQGSMLASGVGTFSATLKTAGTQTITATDAPNSVSGTSNTITVTAAAATHFVVSAQSTTVAGNNMLFTAVAEDQFNNTATGYSGTAAFTSSDTGAFTKLPPPHPLVAGVGAFSATLTTAGNQTLTATDGTIVGTTNSITVSATVGSHFVISAPATATAGAGFQFTVTAEDRYNNPTTAYSGTVAFTSSDTGASTKLPSSNPLSAGVGIFSATLTTAGSQTLTATDTVTSSITGFSNSITVSATTASHFVVTAPGSATAGVPTTFTVTAEDKFNNTATGYTGTVAFASTDGAATLLANAALTGGVGAFSVTLATLGSQTITATDTLTSTITGTSNAITVNLPPATHFAVSAATVSVTAGNPIGFTVTALDQFNHTAVGYSGIVTFSSSDLAATLPADDTLTSGVGAFSATLVTAGTQTLTATDTVTSSIIGSTAVSVNAAATAQFAITAPAFGMTDRAFSFTVLAQDQYGNTATGYTGTVGFSSSDSDPGALMPAASTLSSGVGTFSATLVTIGTQTLSAQDTQTPTITGSTTVTVPVTVYIPSLTTARSATTTVPIEVNALEDPAGTFGQSGLSGGAFVLYYDPSVFSVSPTLGSNNTDVQLGTLGTDTAPGDGYSPAADNGWQVGVTTSDPGVLAITLSNPSGAIPLTGTGGGTLVTVNFHVLPNAPLGSSVINLAATDTTGDSTYINDALDIYNAQASYNLVPAPQNNTVLSPSYVCSGPYPVDGTVTIIGPATHFAVLAPSSVTAGNPFCLTVTAEDQFNYTATGYSGTVHFASSEPQAAAGGALPANATLTGGRGVFAVLLKTAGTQTIWAADTAVSSITGATSQIAVSAAATNHLALSFGPASYPGVPTAYKAPAPASTFANTGKPLVFTVVAEDQFNNLTPTYAGSVHFTSSDPSTNVIVPANSPLTSGVGTFSATLQTPGNQFLTATDVGAPTITGATSAIVTRGLVVTAFTPTPTGFVVTFNKPFNPSTVLIYTSGTTPDDIVLKGLATQPIAGSALFNSPTAPTSITFVKTDVVSAVGTFNPGSGLLSAGNYTVTLRSYSAGTTNGFQDSLGTALDGKDQANPGTNYVFTFSVSAPPTAVGIPDFARGPSNTDALFLPTSIGNGNTFNLIYTNPNTSPATGTATVTFSTIGATLQSNIQSALNALRQIGLGAGNVPNAEAVVTNTNTIGTQGANVLVTFQNSYFVTATAQGVSSTTPGVSIALATINAANNLAGNGIPVTLSNGQNVTSGSFTLQYNPTLLTITGGLPKIAITGFSFTVTPTINNATSASAVISFSSPSKISSTTASLTLGSLLATVPFSATASYGAKQLLHFSSEQLNTTASSNIAVTNQDAVEVAAFFGDVNDTGLPFASSGAVGAIGMAAGSNANLIQQTLTGFPLFPNLDPLIIGEVNLGGTPNITSLDTNKMNQQLTSGQPTIPWLPTGLTVTPVGPDPTLSISRMSEVGSPMSAKSGADIGLPTSDFRLPTSDFRLFAVNIDTARPPGSTGMVEAALALTYDPKVFDVSAADVQLGTVPESGTGWKLQAEVNAQTGLIGVELSSTTAIQNTAGGSLVTIAMHLRGEPGVLAPGVAPTTTLTLVPYVDPAAGPRVYQTSVADTQGEFVIHLETGKGPVDGLDSARRTSNIAPTVDSAHRTSHIEPALDFGLWTSDFGAIPDIEPSPSALYLAVAEQVFGDLEQTRQLMQYSALAQLSVILASESNEQPANEVCDLALLQAPAGVPPAEWLPEEPLAHLKQKVFRDDDEGL